MESLKWKWPGASGSLCLDVNGWLLVWLFISNRRRSRRTVASSSRSLVPLPFLPASGRLVDPPRYALEVPWAPSAAVTRRCAPSEAPLPQLPNNHVSLPACGHLPLVPLQTPLSSVRAIAHCRPMFPAGRLRLKGQGRGPEPRTRRQCGNPAHTGVSKGFFSHAHIFLSVWTCFRAGGVQP